MGSTDLVYALIAILAVALVLLVRRRRTPDDAPSAASDKKPEPTGPGDTEPSREKLEGAAPRGPTDSDAAAQLGVPEKSEPSKERPVEGRATARGPAVREEQSRQGKPKTSKQKPAALDVGGLRRGLAKSRAPDGFFGKLKALLGADKQLNAAIAEDIEEVLLSSDVGVQATEAILERVRAALGHGDLSDTGRVWQALRQEARRILDVATTSPGLEEHPTPTVVVLVGVNGSGKTTTLGKLATRLAGVGHGVVLAAGDTFRAAAVQQLVVWGERAGSEVVRGKEGGDPASVIFDAIRRAKETSASFVLADTAGRLHTQANLVQEIQKVVRSAAKAMEGAPHELLLVIDATNGQNALAQAKQFREALPLTGIVLTKLDGTAKGGVVLGICDVLGLPIRYIGIGERADDLRDFSSDEFLEALLGKDTEASAA